MTRTIIYHPEEIWVGHKISEFLRNKSYTRQNLTTLRYDEGSIVQNGKVVHMNFLISAGDEITIHIREKSTSEHVIPVQLPFPVVYEDEDLVVVNKPAGMPSHPSMKNYENTLGNAAAYYFGKQMQNALQDACDTAKCRNGMSDEADGFVYRCVNRLDKDTTGLTMIAKHMVSGGILYEQIQKKLLRREYVAIVEGEDIPDQGTVDLPLARDPNSAIARMVDFEHGDRAVTHYETLHRGAGLSFVKFHLETGRTHQIRVHMCAIGHPLIGDFLYHPEDTRMHRQALHARELSFIQPMTGEKLCIRVELPEDMRSVLAVMGYTEE